MAGPRLIVNPPAFTPSPYGLLSVAQQVTGDGTPHWQNGITWQSRCLSPMGRSTYDECIVVTGSGGPPPEPNPKTDVLDLTLRGATPFTAYAKFDCALVGMDEALQIATDALAQSEPWQVERAFWTGLVDGRSVAFPHLAANADIYDAQSIKLQSAATVVTGTAIDAVTALGLLESALADCYNGVGVIHVPVKLLPTLQFHNLVFAQNGKLRTLNGNLVAVGGGYPGTSPAGVAAGLGEAWMYATGAVFMYRGSVQVPSDRVSSINRTNNTREMIAERTYVIGWDCCHHAILVDIGAPVT